MGSVRPTKILSTHFSKPLSSLSSSFSSVLALKDAQFPVKKANLSLRSSIMATPFQSSSSTLGEMNENMMALTHDSMGANDLLIVGPGVLGRLVAEQWREEFWDCQIYGQTVTTNHHEELKKLGIKPSLKGNGFKDRFPYVIFCAPPSQSSNYAAELRLAASNWNGEGSFLFTSSSAPFNCFDNGKCDEESPVVPLGKSPKTDVLLKAEKVVLEEGGTVLRLAGLYISFFFSYNLNSTKIIRILFSFMRLLVNILFLLNLFYTADRGAHTYWLRKGIVDARPDHIVNLIHYEDAASLAVAIMKKNSRGRVFVGCDNHPLSRQEVMELVAKSGKYDKKFEAFTSTSGPSGKKLNNAKTRADVGWEPKYPSFAHFLGVPD